MCRFISLKLIFPALYDLLREGGEIACLIKPQFEAGPEKVGKKGVVRDPKVHLEVLENFLTHAKDNHFTVLGITYSPIRGPEGNIEYLGYLRKSVESDTIPDACGAGGRLPQRTEREKGQRMKRVILCPNPYRDNELTVAKRSRQLLEQIGFETVVCLPFSREGYGDQLGVPIRQLQQEIKRADLLIAFGGDGTILHLARTVALHNVPVLGINLGSLGFMSELEPNELERLNDLKNWDFTVESRMMLDVTVLREGRPVYNNIALNDAVVSKGSVARVVRLDVTTEEGRLTKITGDGGIVSTPTGSTGYSMAAGGPIVEPTARNLLLTPICPHSTRAGSYVLSPEHIITIEAADANRKFVYLSVDGGKAFSLKNGDKVRVRQSRFTTKLVRLSKKSFCEILDSKMGMEVATHEE